MRKTPLILSLIAVVCLVASLGGHQTRPAATAAPATAAASKRPAVSSVHHVLSARLDPARHTVAVTDEIAWPADNTASQLTFVLNSTLRVTASDPSVEEVIAPATAHPVGIEQGSVAPNGIARVSSTWRKEPKCQDAEHH